MLQRREKNGIAAVETIKQFFFKFKIKNYFQSRRKENKNEREAVFEVILSND